MFRNPRSTAPIASERPLLPSTGRAPTPPLGPNQLRSPVDNTNTIAMASSVTPLIGRTKLPQKRTPPVMPSGKGKGKTNGNIMSFFKRADSTSTNGASAASNQEGLFFEEVFNKGQRGVNTQTPTPPRDASSDGLSPEKIGDASAETPLSRYNEDKIPLKRRRVEDNSPGLDILKVQTTNASPFLDDSDEEGERIHNLTADLKGAQRDLDDSKPFIEDDIVRASPHPFEMTNRPAAPPLKHEPTSVGDADGFDGVEDFIEDEFPEEGEEFLERKWMEEEAEQEIGSEDEEEGLESSQMPAGNIAGMDETVAGPQNIRSSTCPICNRNTTGLSDEQLSLHVNDCIDGKVRPFPMQNLAKENPMTSEKIKIEKEPSIYKRFQRATIARPGQENPFDLNTATSGSSSAFSKLMSGNAEDNAWATAAAAENASRGKPAYQRTCPFYKIMPGFSICVDAFRYGAVQGCNAYFLSHFHSDHYIGLTSSWCHGPIYCSHVTANLVRRQLRVDPKWVVDLEFDNKVEVPNTHGVEVTMIPANHCPGSSLYLFEKVIGKGKNPKVQRVLHCGDFRACPAHVQHPKLRPDIVDTVTKRNLAQQKIDVCYLDTTYLTPRYAFPRQEEVIRACGDMCVSLSKDFVDENDGWEQTKKERAGTGMVKFVSKSPVKREPFVEQNHENHAADIKAEDEDTKVKIEDGETEADLKDQLSMPDKNNKARGRLLVIVGTYSIGKERICVGVAKALNSKIYAPPNKQKICAALEDPELSALITGDPFEAQVHMQMLMEIRAETLADYLTGYKPHFSRIVGFRPSGWNYRPPNSRFTESPAVQTVLHSDNWKSGYTMAELVPQRGSTREANCYGVPYSEHSSFRELTMFCCALRIDKIIPTVNVGSAKSREKMKGWCEKWAADKKKNGLYKVEVGQTAW